MHTDVCLLLCCKAPLEMIPFCDCLNFSLPFPDFLKAVSLQPCTCYFEGQKSGHHRHFHPNFFVWSQVKFACFWSFNFVDLWILLFFENPLTRMESSWPAFVLLVVFIICFPVDLRILGRLDQASSSLTSPLCPTLSKVYNRFLNILLRFQVAFSCLDMHSWESRKSLILNLNIQKSIMFYLA